MTIPKISPWIGQLVRVKEFEKCFWQSLATIFFFFKNGMATNLVVV